MMEAKRILPWEHYDDGMDEWTADTEIRRYRVDMDEGLFSATGYTSEWDYPLGEKCGYSSLDAAMDVCEQDYVALCTQFLHLYNPATHVVVSREAAERWLVRMENAACICRVERANNTANELYESAAELRAALEEKSC